MRYLAAAVHVLLTVPVVLLFTPVVLILYAVLLVVFFGEWGWNGGADKYGSKCSFCEYVRRQ